MKTKLSLLVLTLCISTMSGALAQGPVTSPNAARSATIMAKVHKVDLLVQLLPLALRKDQFGPILASIEKVRQKQKFILSSEDDELEKLNADLTAAVDGALDKGNFPPTAMQFRGAKLLKALSIRRMVAVSEMVDDMYSIMKSTLDAGQLKVIENSLEPSLIDPSIKKDSLDATGKIKFFIRQFMLDPVTYELLISLQKTAS